MIVTPALCQVHPPYDGTVRYNYGDVVRYHDACYRCVQYEKGAGYWKRYHHRSQERSQVTDSSPDRLAMLEF